ncbi:MAG: patatin family protein [Clostridia bacterium]|nr:patatin family protein [Clostridia bacterium]
MKKTALILEGGAMRGMFSCGVTDVFLENGVEFDGAAGISAGAAFGCNFKSRQAGRAIRYNKRYGRDPRYCSVRSLVKTGDLYGADFCYRQIPDVLDPFDRDAFRENPMAFYVGATDVMTGEAVYHRLDDGGSDDIRWMRASASMPLVSRPVRIGDRWLLDGGIVDAVPFAYMEGLGYNRNVAVLTQPKGYRKSPVKGMALFRLGLRKYPAVAEAMAHRHERYNAQMEQIDAREAAGILLVIRPEAGLGISRTESDPEQLERVYRLGRAQGEKRLEEVRAFLER